MASEAQNNANRENAQKSNGPTSNDGFERCKASPVTHGLFAKLGRLITDSEEAYEKCIKNTFLRLQPANESEEALVEEIAQNEWKLKRATLWEQSVVAKGIWDNRHSFNDEEECPAEIRDVIVLGQVLQTNSKVLSNMNSNSPAPAARWKKVLPATKRSVATVNSSKRLNATLPCKASWANRAIRS